MEHRLRRPAHDGTVTRARARLLTPRYLSAVATATALVAVCPVLAVWALRRYGAMTSAALGVLIGVGLSLAAAQLGALYWRGRRGSRELLFSELLLWGFVHRCYLEARVASASKLLGRLSDAQGRVPAGLTRARQTRLLEGLARAMDARDPSTHGHSRRVARHAWMIAKRLGLPREEVARIRTAAAIHDIGKLQTPIAILKKAGPLTGPEYEVIKRHPDDGARIAAALNDVELAEMIGAHHERLDGSGYPCARKGDEVPLGARIIAVADTFDAITASRPYQPARPHREALAILRAEAPDKLDARVVKAFCGYYSGRRPLAMWASLTSLPTRAVEQLGGGVVAGAGAAVKAAGVALLVGALAGGGATLAASHQAPPEHQPLPRGLYVAPASAPSAPPTLLVALQSRPASAGGAPGSAHRRGHETGAHAGAQTTSGATATPAVAATLPAAGTEATSGPGASGAGASEQHGGGPGSGEGTHGRPEEGGGRPEETRGGSGEAHGGGSGEAHGGGSGEAHGGGSGEAHGKSGETHGGGSGEAHGGGSTETHGSSGETHGGGSTETHGGGSTETHGASGEAHGGGSNETHAASEKSSSEHGHSTEVAAGVAEPAHGKPAG